LTPVEQTRGINFKTNISAKNKDKIKFVDGKVKKIYSRDLSVFFCFLFVDDSGKLHGIPGIMSV